MKLPNFKYQRAGLGDSNAFLSKELRYILFQKRNLFKSNVAKSSLVFLVEAINSYLYVKFPDLKNATRVKTRQL